MIGYLPEHAAEFMELFARLEHALRRNGYARTDQERAVVNNMQVDPWIERQHRSDSLPADPIDLEPGLMHRMGRGNCHDAVADGAEFDDE